MKIRTLASILVSLVLFAGWFPTTVSADVQAQATTMQQGATQNADEHFEGDGHDHSADGHHDGDGHDHGVDGHGQHGPLEDLSVFWILPFALVLLSIAIMPLVNEHWWEHNSNKAKIAVPLGLLVAGYLAVNYGAAGQEKIMHAVVEYVQFIALLGSLYIISGGIVFRGDINPTPKTNTLILAVGGGIASFVGTTGASMLLIRPLLRANAARKHIVHTVVFFIFIVSNIGGCLTPLGDPPLFLGYLRGVPFGWCFSLLGEWALMNGVLLVIYFIWDSAKFKSENFQAPQGERAPVKIVGKINFIFLLGVVLSVAFLTPSFLAPFGLSPFVREGVMILMIVLSLNLTPKGLREENEFNYHPISEVAVLFIGIFLTMIPALNTLQMNGPELGVNKAWQFFLFTGILSSFLDNAPTYVVFFELAGTMQWDPAIYGEVIANGVPNLVLTAISLGAVFMGANTYIGNGPNFMVKAIAEQSGVKMPSFFGYMVYSFGLLMPLFIAVKFIWFQH